MGSATAAFSAFFFWRFCGFAISRAGGSADSSVEGCIELAVSCASELRTAFSKHGGSLGESGSVAFMFDRVGRILYAPEAASADAILEAAIEVGAENVESSADGHEITCRPESFSEVRDGLEARFGPAREARLAWRPVTTVPVAQDTAETLLKLLDVLEDSDDVQTVSANFEIGADVMARLTA